MPGRTAAQLSRTPGEWKERQQEERRAILAALLRELEAARRRGDPWYQWVERRHRGEHLHGATDEKGRLIACPAPGCDHGRGTANGHPPLGGRGRTAEPRHTNG